MDRLVLSIDQGTTSSRAIVFDQHGRVIGVAQAPITQHYPHPGWVNQDGREIWDVTRRVAVEAIQQLGDSSRRLAAIGIANQRETTLLWDAESGEPVAPAIVWQSRQSAALVDQIVGRGMAEIYQRITGLVPDAYFSATKIAWLLDHDDALRQRADAGELRFGTVDSWLMWNLSGGQRHVTDYANASRTMLFDLRTLNWSNELLSDLNIPRSLLPAVVPNSVVHFEADAGLFGATLPVAGVAGDQQAALFGQACFDAGEAKNTYGTGSFLLLQTGATPVPSRHRLLTTIAWGLDGAVSYALEGAIFVTGAAVQWLRDGLGIIEHVADAEALANAVDDSGDVVFVPALSGLGAPHWDQDARGAIVGITRGTTAAHIARATLEAIAFQTRDVVDAMRADSGVELTELRVDGGAAANDLLMQIQADVLGVPVVRPRTTETTALGAAYLAGLATGVWNSTEDIRGHWIEDRRFDPHLNERERSDRYDRWREAVARSRSWARRD
ncbi:MAG: glycerol kinase GlpK [Thermomicrobiales bacterium]